MAFCTKCGANIEEGIRFCTGCGTPVGGSVNNAGTVIPEQATTSLPPKKKNIKRNMLIAVAGVVILALVFYILPPLLIRSSYSSLDKGNYDMAIIKNNIANILSLLQPDIKSTSYSNLAFVYFLYGHYDEAITYSTKAIKLNDSDSNAYKFRGYAYIGKGEFDRAISDYETALRLDPYNDALYKELIEDAQRALGR